MKTFMRIILLLLLISLSGCKAKEKVKEKVTERAESVISSATARYVQTNQQDEASTIEEATDCGWSDRMIEKLHERIVRDSTGRVLLHDLEHSKEMYTDKTQSQMKRTANRNERSTCQNDEHSHVIYDSIYNGGILNEVTVVRKKSWSWLWFAGLLASLLSVGYILSRVYR